MKIKLYNAEKRAHCFAGINQKTNKILGIPFRGKYKCYRIKFEK